jgi:hypothetical protein
VGGGRRGTRRERRGQHGHSLIVDILQRRKSIQRRGDQVRQQRRVWHTHRGTSPCGVLSPQQRLQELGELLGESHSAVRWLWMCSERGGGRV